MNAQGYRIVDGQGKPFADIWLRKSIPASSKPAGAKGVIQFPFLAESELLGVIQLPGEGHDYRDQAIAKGIYTVRYGLQPVNGDHLGVSPFRRLFAAPARRQGQDPGDPAPQATRDPERRVRRIEPSRGPVHAGRSRDRRRRVAVDDPRCREEHLAGGRPAEPVVKGESKPMASRLDHRGRCLRGRLSFRYVSTTLGRTT